MEQQVQRTTFYLLGCERCEWFAAPPPRFDAPSNARTQVDPMRCSECGDPLLLAECFVAPQTVMWQASEGSMWKAVVYPESLPESPSRQVWMRDRPSFG